MLIFDQLKKNDPQLRLLGFGVLVGLLVLITGLWWVQIVSARDYRENLQAQSFRTVRIPAVRGCILDRNGKVLAENRPVYNVSLYLEELRPEFRKEYSRVRPRRVVTNSPPFWKRWIGAKPVVRTLYEPLTKAQIDALSWQARDRVVSNAVTHISQILQRPPAFNTTNFRTHYTRSLPLPYRVAANLNPIELGRFQEQHGGAAGVDLEILSLRHYPQQTTAAHLLGHLRKDDRSIAGEFSFFDYRLADYQGSVGLEYAFDSYLHGRAGVKSVLINHLGFRQNESILSPAEAGSNIVLTLDADIQRAAEHTLWARGPRGKATRGAAVVMDVNTGDILALASSPTYDPNLFAQGISAAAYADIQSNEAEKNRATQERYRPGSIFKTIVALACLENGLDPEAIYEVRPNPAEPSKGAYFLAGRKIGDTAPPGDYNFKLALIRSSNSYFIHYGLRHLNAIIHLGQRLHLGERMELGTLQETSGGFPSPESIRRGWRDGDTANLCIGQGAIDVTPLQMAVMASALANGGKVLWPRFVDRIEPQDPLLNAGPTVFPKGRVRDLLPVKPRNLQILHNAMLADVEDRENGSGKDATVAGMKIYGKTGTAENDGPKGDTTWFLSFGGPAGENPRYAVIIMVEDGSSGGGTCAPMAHDVYVALQQMSKKGARNGAVALTR